MTGPGFTVRFGCCTLILCALLLSCQRVQKTQASRGASLFARVCSGCHGPTGREGVHVGYKVPPRDLGNARLYEELSDEQIKNVIRNGKGQMPAFGRALAPQDLDDLLSHLHTLATSAHAAAATSAPNTKTK